MNGNDPATKSDLQNAVEQLRSEMKQGNEQLRGEMTHQYNDLVERIADSETRIVHAIYDLAKAGNQRMTQIEGDNAAINQRLGTLESRLLEVERRLNLPPAA